MSAEFSSADLIEVVFRDVFLAAVRDCEEDFRNPPGREPDARLLALHEWYSGLDEGSRRQVRNVLVEAASAATFGMLAIMDNVRPVAPGYEVELHVFAVSQGQRIRLGEFGDLHDMFTQRLDRLARE